MGHNRQRHRWFSCEHYASVMRIKEFYETNIGKSFTGIISNAPKKTSGENDFVLIFDVSLQSKAS